MISQCYVFFLIMRERSDGVWGWWALFMTPCIGTLMREFLVNIGRVNVAVKGGRKSNLAQTWIINCVQYPGSYNDLRDDRQGVGEGEVELD